MFFSSSFVNYFHFAILFDMVSHCFKWVLSSIFVLFALFFSVFWNEVKYLLIHIFLSFNGGGIFK